MASRFRAALLAATGLLYFSAMVLLDGQAENYTQGGIFRLHPKDDS